MVEIGHPSDATPLRATVKVRNPRGLHMRAAFAFAKVAGRFRSNIKVRNESKIADGKSGTRLMTLGATPETELVFSPDARRQLLNLRAFDQRRLVDAIRQQLVEEDPSARTRHKFALDPSPENADY